MALRVLAHSTTPPMNNVGYIVKQYGHWAEYKATDKTALRNFLYGRIDSIVELNK